MVYSDKVKHIEELVGKIESCLTEKGNRTASFCIPVLPQDIRNAMPGMTRCAAALALKRRFPYGHPFVFAGGVHVGSYKLKTSEGVRDYVYAFDDNLRTGKETEPIILMIDPMDMTISTADEWWEKDLYAFS